MLAKLMQKSQKLCFVNVSIFGLLIFRLPHSVVGSLSIIVAVNTDFICAFHFTLAATGMDAKLPNCGRWSE
jgi:hypothetical protein